MNKIKKIMFCALFVISSIAWGDEIKPMYTSPDGPNGLAWFITIVNNTGNLISVGKTVTGRNNNWNLSVISGNSLLDSGQSVEPNSQKSFVTYQSNNFPAHVTSYVEFFIDTEVVSLNGVQNISRREYIYSFYIFYQGLYWTVTYPSSFSTPDGTAAVEATITYNGKNNITSSISYCPKNCY